MARTWILTGSPERHAATREHHAQILMARISPAATRPAGRLG